MKCRKIFAVVFVTVFLGIFSLAGIGGASDMGTVVKKACSSCHSSKRTCINLGVKNAEAWETTVKRMVDKGARLTPDQVKPVIDYLTGLAHGSGPLCD